MKPFTRKLNKVGEYSYSIVIPKILVDELGWREHQKISISLKPRKRLELKDWKRK